MDEERILQFCNFTNASRETAISFLEMTGGNTEQAVTLYIETGESQTTGTTGTTGEPQVSEGGAADPNSTFESDAELARQLAQEVEPGIRAPIAPKRDILVGNNEFDDYSILNSRRLAARSHRVPRGPFRNFDGEEIVNISDPHPLDDLYRQPFDIMSKENFERTRNEARNKQKWLMVDIQETSEFSCIRLNSDLWSDKTVKDIIKENFLFLQFYSDETDGRHYRNFYPVTSYPHIAIIDPRTGERLKIWSDPISPTDFLIAVTDFLDRYSLGENAPKRNIEKSEQQQLDAALAASVSHDNDFVDLESEDENMEDPESSPNNNEEMPVSVFDSIRPVERAQVQGPNATTIKFRLADGKTVIRHFGKTDPVRHLFEYIKVSVPEAREQPFELVCYSDNLIDKVDMTIEQAGLANAVVNMVLG